MTRVWMHKETGELILSEALYRHEGYLYQTNDPDFYAEWQCGWIIMNEDGLGIVVSVDAADSFEDLGEL